MRIALKLKLFDKLPKGRNLRFAKFEANNSKGLCKRNALKTRCQAKKKGIKIFLQQNT